MDKEYDPRAALARTCAERRRRRKAIELHRRRSAERTTYLLAQLELGETAVAAGPQALVTDRRVLFAWRRGLSPRPRQWTHDALTFEEITRWTVGRRHDHRPLLRLAHPQHVRVEQVIAHRFLWARWGNAERGVSHEETTLYFASRGDPVFRAIKERLERTNASQGEPSSRPSLARARSASAEGLPGASLTSTATPSGP